LPSL
jgi:hypothetical protein